MLKKWRNSTTFCRMGWPRWALGMVIAIGGPWGDTPKEFALPPHHQVGPCPPILEAYLPDNKIPTYLLARRPSCLPAGRWRRRGVGWAAGAVRCWGRLGWRGRRPAQLSDCTWVIWPTPENGLDWCRDSEVPGRLSSISISIPVHLNTSLCCWLPLPPFYQHFSERKGKGHPLHSPSRSSFLCNWFENQQGDVVAAFPLLLIFFTTASPHKTSPQISDCTIGASFCSTGPGFFQRAWVAALFWDTGTDRCHLGAARYWWAHVSTWNGASWSAAMPPKHISQAGGGSVISLVRGVRGKTIQWLGVGELTEEQYALVDHCT